MSALVAVGAVRLVVLVDARRMVMVVDAPVAVVARMGRQLVGLAVTVVPGRRLGLE